MFYYKPTRSTGATIAANNNNSEIAERDKQRNIPTILGHRPYRFYHTPPRPPPTLVNIPLSNSNSKIQSISEMNDAKTYCEIDACQRSIPPNVCVYENHNTAKTPPNEVHTNSQNKCDRVTSCNEDMFSNSPQSDTDSNSCVKNKTSPTIPIDTSDTNLRILNINCQSIKNKIASFFNIVDNIKPNIIIGTETWLDPSIKDCEVFPPDFTVFRKDRDNHGGGVFIAIHQGLSSSYAEELDEDCEIIWAKVEIAGLKTLYICSYYRPHVNDEESLVNLTKSINKTSANSNSIIIIGGDFNFPGWNWKNRTLKSNTPFVTLHTTFGNLLDDCALTQLIDEPTRCENTLDLMITNYPNLVTRQEVVPGISDHEAVYVDFDVKPIKNKQKPRHIPLYNRANWHSLKVCIDKTAKQLEENKDNHSTEELWLIFKEALNTGIEENIPHKLSKTKNSQPWVTHKLRKKIKKRDRIYKKFKKTGYTKHAEKYKKLKHEIQKELRKEYWEYVEQLFTPDESRNPYSGMKKFWSYIKHRKLENNGIAPIMKDGELHTSAYDRAKALNEQFQSVFSSKQPLPLKYLAQNILIDKCDYSPREQPVIDDITIKPEGISKLLKNLDPTKACGPDNIQSRVMKELADSISPCLCTIFQKSLDTGDVPNDWRRANVAPIYKKGSRSLASNYRPVSLTCISSKIMEHIIVSHIMKYSDKHDILYDFQHGFRSKLSCETQLINFIDDVSKTLERNQQTDVLIMDFSKAFDKVDHDLLCHKLKRYGITGKINKWINNFLKNRTQSVVVEGESSPHVSVQSGVPQGSVMGPALFLLYINDIADHISSKVRLFADDTIVYLTVKSSTDAETLQKDLNKLTDWEYRNRMEFHPEKCNVISITRKRNPIKYTYKLHGHTLEHLQSAKYLGLTIQSDLKWDTHITNITSKANRTLGFLRRNLKINSRNVKEKAYTSLVRPLVEYACTVWDPYTKTNIDNIEMVQRRAARFVTGVYEQTASVSEMIETLGWQSLQQRRQNSRLSMMYKVKNNMVAIGNPDLKAPARLSRNAHPDSFVPISTSTNFRKYSFFPRTIVDWNKLPRKTTSATTLESFVKYLPC